MKKSMSLVAICIIFCSTMTGADFIKLEPAGVKLRVHCGGYTIIEAGKGIDCNGDTLQLVRKNGYYELAFSRTKTVRL